MLAHSHARSLLSVAIGALAGWICSRLHTPIPWMLGPLCTLALLRVLGRDLPAPPGGRQAGQWIIGTSLALYFTPHVVRQVTGLWPWLAAGALFAILLGYLLGLVLSRLADLDRTSAVFACVPGGAAEMAVLGERFGARVDKVAAGQSMRILIVVMLLPAVYTLLGVHGADVYVPGTTRFDAQGMAVLLAGTFAGGAIAQRLRLPNAFVLGPLAIAIPLTAMEINLSAIPVWATNSAQCLLGCALGCRFQPDFLHGAPRFVAAMLVTSVVGILVCAGFGALLAWATGLYPATLILGTAPGGIAEMCITAKVLQLGVPLVTAFHVSRVVVILLGTAPFFAFTRAWHRRRRGRIPTPGEPLA
ncbi:MAG TPA: AbrB family transcriptional regulator [Casimicrobiaceae bacterium]|nr:AbrB family transcriptional regulator [Casimicrobiaceae bacterium]